MRDLFTAYLLWGATGLAIMACTAFVVWLCWQSVQPPLNTTIIYKDQSRMTALCAVEFPLASALRSRVGRSE